MGNEKCRNFSCSLCNKLYTYLYHHIIVLDKYIHCNLVYYKHNGGDKPYDVLCYVSIAEVPVGEGSVLQLSRWSF